MALSVALIALLSWAASAPPASARPASTPHVAVYAPKTKISTVRVALRWRTPVRIARRRRITFLGAGGRRLSWRPASRGYHRRHMFKVSAAAALERIRIGKFAIRTRRGAWISATTIRVARRTPHETAPQPVPPAGGGGAQPSPTPPAPTPPAPTPPAPNPPSPPPPGSTLPLAQPQSAAAFVDSVGVNVHMSYYSTAYNDWQNVRDKLVELGVRHVRDGACVGCSAQRQRLLALAAAGIGVDFTMRQPGSPDSLQDLVSVLAGPMRPAVDSIEGPNEYDHSGDPVWPASLRAYQQQLYGLVRSTPALAGVPVIGPSLVDSRSYSTLGNLLDSMNWGNVHPYAGGQVPEINLGWDRGLEATVAPAAPVAVTEAGYHNALNATTGQPPVSEGVAAAYVPRLFLDMFRAGVPRTYLYELLDERPDPGATDPESDFGLLRSDFSEKPAFRTLAALLHLTNPQGSFQLEPLPLDVDDTASDLRELLLQTGASTYALVLWRNAKVWDQAERQDLAVDSEDVRVQFGAGLKARVQQLDRPAMPDEPAGTSIDVGVSAMPVVVTLTA